MVDDDAAATTTGVSGTRQQQPIAASIGLVSTDKLVNSQRTSATSLLSNNNNNNGYTSLSSDNNPPGVVRHVVENMKTTNNKGIFTSCTRELLGSSSLTESGRQSLEELAELKFADCKLQGRDEQLKILRAAYDRVKSHCIPNNVDDDNDDDGQVHQAANGSSFTSLLSRTKTAPEMVLISGDSGTGKTALAKSLLVDIRQSNRRGGSSRRNYCNVTIGSTGSSNFFPMSDNSNLQVFIGKFDMNRENNEPYAAIIAAFEAVCSSLNVKKSPDNKNNRRARGSTTSSFSIEDELIKDKLRLDLMQELYGTSDVDVVMRTKNELVSAIPSLNEFLWQGVLEEDESMTVSSGSSSSGRSIEQSFRMEFLFRSLARLLSAYFQPLVIIVDDLQWADKASFDLVTKLLEDTTNPSLLLIGTIRSDDPNIKDPNSAISTWLKSMRAAHDQGANTEDARNRFEEIKLEAGLSVACVNKLISSVLRTEAERTISLAQAVHRKTIGNPFFVIQFIRVLKDMEILDFDLRSMSWVWDQTLVEEMFVTKNKKEILDHQLQKLDVPSLFVAEVASCLGAKVNIPVLFVAFKAVVAHLKDSVVEDSNNGKNYDTEISEDMFLESLEQLLSVGVMERGSNDSIIHFAHDQIQKAANEMIAPNALPVWQVTIGEAIFYQMTPHDIEENFFMIADLCNRGIASLRTNAESEDLHNLKRLKLMELNRRAGLKAMTIASYAAASKYLEIAIGLLDNDCLEGDYGPVLDLYANAAECEYCIGNYEVMNSYLQVVLQSDIPFEDKLHAHTTMITALCARGKFPETIAQSRKVLNQMDVGRKFPSKNPSPLRIILELVRARRATKRSVEELSKLPILGDTQRIYTDRLLDLLCGAAYSSRPEYFPLPALRHVQLCVKHGVSSHSPAAFCLLGIVLCGKMGALKEGYDKGRVAVALLDRLPQPRVAESRVAFLANFFIFHWQESGHLSLKRLEKGYKKGMQLGDVDSASYCKMSLVATSFGIGKSLREVDKVARRSVRLIKEYDHAHALFIIRTVWQLALKLMKTKESQEKPVTDISANKDDALLLTGDVFDQEQTIKEKQSSHEISFIYSMQMQLAYYMDAPSLMEDLMEKSKQYPDFGAGTFFHQRHMVFEGLVSFYLIEFYSENSENLRSDRRRRQNVWTKRARQARNKIKQWAENGNVNIVHIVPLFEAEWTAIVQKQPSKARQLYEKAIVQSSRNGYVHDRAVAHERAGLNFLRMKDEYWAKHHLESALECFASWGALAKMRVLSRKHKEVFEMLQM